VLDVATGEVLAVVNQPSYNPNNKASISDFSVVRNRAITDVFEPGSTVKAFTMFAALESGLFAPSSLIETRGWMMIGGYEVKDSLNYGTLSLEQVITKSSNVGSSKIALSVGPEALRDVLGRVGFGEVTSSGFPGEWGGVLPPIRPGWSRFETATLSFGYGLSASALQLAQAYSVIARGGIKRPLSLLKQDDEALAKQPVDQVIDGVIAKQVIAMLETVANVPLYTVAGKTGTARLLSKDGGYTEDEHNSLFVGMAPATDPRIVVAVVINDPKGKEHYGGQVSAPVFSRIVSGSMRILNIAPDKLQ
jgi:cell division protein FtsI (penicillin-binding protein 3)